MLIRELPDSHNFVHISTALFGFGPSLCQREHTCSESIKHLRDGAVENAVRYAANAFGPVQASMQEDYSFLPLEFQPSCALFPMQELLEACLKDPLIQAAASTAYSTPEQALPSSPLIAKLRFLVLKNLAALLGQRDDTAMRGLQLYCQALCLEDDSVVLWQQMGTLVRLAYVHRRCYAVTAQHTRLSYLARLAYQLVAYAAVHCALCLMSSGVHCDSTLPADLVPMPVV